VKTAGLWTLTVFQGQQATGGYSIVTSDLTSPASSVELPFAPDAIVLFDQDSHERARLAR